LQLCITHITGTDRSMAGFVCASFLAAHVYES